MEYIYAALLLHKLGKPINEENLKKVIESTDSQADETKIKSIVASLKDVDIEKILSEAQATPQATQVAVKQEKEEKKEKPEEAAEGLAALFG
ncbi:MAG: 50S ribosomal protein L12 [Candidatus Pacearchaeota archaeon]